MARDQLVATVIALVAAMAVWLHDPPHDDLEDRLAAIGFAWLMVMGWRLLAKWPSFSFIHRFATDYRTFRPGPVFAVITWLLFALVLGAVVFQ